MDTLLFDPIGIDTFYGWPIEFNNNQLVGHHSNPDSTITPVNLTDHVRLHNLRFLEPAGIISMNINDLAKFLQLHLLARRGKPALLTQEAFDILHFPIEEYGCGILISDTANGKLLRHNGSDAASFYIRNRNSTRYQYCYCHPRQCIRPECKFLDLFIST